MQIVHDKLSFKNARCILTMGSGGVLCRFERYSLPAMSLMLCDGKIWCVASEVLRVVWCFSSGSEGVNVIAVTETNITNYTSKALNHRSTNFQTSVCTFIRVPSLLILHIRYVVRDKFSKNFKKYIKIIMYTCFSTHIHFDYARRLFTLNSHVTYINISL